MVRLAREDHRGLGVHALDQVVDPLVRDQPSRVENLFHSRETGKRPESRRVRSTMDHPDLGGPLPVSTGIEVAHKQETRRAVDGSKPPVKVPVTARMVGQEDLLSEQPGDQDTLIRQESLDLVHMHYIRPGDRHCQARRNRSKALAPDIRDRTKDLYAQTIHVPCQGFAE